MIKLTKLITEMKSSDGILNSPIESLNLTGLLILYLPKPNDNIKVPIYRFSEKYPNYVILRNYINNRVNVLNPDSGVVYKAPIMSRIFKERFTVEYDDMEIEVKFEIWDKELDGELLITKIRIQEVLND